MPARRVLIGCVILVAVSLAWVWGASDDRARRDDDARSPAEPSSSSVGATEEADSPIRRGRHDRTVEDPLQEAAARLVLELPGGRAVEGAECALFQPWQFPDVPGDAAATARSDAAGAAVLRAVPGRYVVRCRHPRLRIVQAEVSLPSEEVVRPLVAPGRPVVIRVVDDDDRPVVGARVWESHDDAGPVVTTGEDGVADLGALPWRNAFLEVAAPGFAEYRNYLVVEAATLAPLEHTIRLERVGHDVPFVVRVVDESKRPVADAVVAVGHAGRRRRAVTDDDGVARTTVSTSGELDLRVSAPDGRRVRMSGVDPMVGSIDVVVPAGRRLTGRVGLLGSEEPVANAVVLLRRRDGVTEEAVTGPAGTFMPAEVPTESVELAAFAPGFAVVQAAWGEERDESENVLLPMVPTAVVTGRVVDRAAVPVEGARVRVLHPRETWPLAMEPLEAYTDASGEFVLIDVPPYEGLRLIAEHDEHGLAWIDDELPVEPATKLLVGDLMLPGWFEFGVPVVDREGEPVRVATMWVSWRYPARGTEGSYRDVVDGVFDTVRVPRPSASIRVHAPGFLPHDMLPVEASLERLVLHRPGIATARLVQHSDGSAVTAARVELHSMDRLHTLEGNHAVADTDAAGEVTLRGMRPGRYELRVDGYQPLVVDLPDEETALGQLQLRAR